jgi:hypothetical protein
MVYVRALMRNQTNFARICMESGIAARALIISRGRAQIRKHRFARNSVGSVMGHQMERRRNNHYRHNGRCWRRFSNGEFHTVPNRYCR